MLVDLLYARLQNFVLYEDETFDFTNTGTYFINGINLDKPGYKSNGTGKTLLLDAIAWCVYGKIVRGTSGDSIVGKHGEGACVTTKWFIGSKLTVIRRYRGHPKHGNNVIVKRDGKELTRHTTADTQEVINRLFGFSFETFVNVVLHDSKCKLRFVTARDVARKDIFVDIAGVSRIDSALKAARADYKEVTKEILKVESLYNTTEVRLEEARSRKKEHKENSVAFKEDMRIEAKRIRKLIDESVERKRVLEENILKKPDTNRIQKKIDELSSRLNSELQELSGQIEPLSRRITSLTRKIFAEQASAASIESQICKAQKLDGGECPLCHSTVSCKHLKKWVDISRGKIEWHESGIIGLRRKRKFLEEEASGLDDRREATSSELHDDSGKLGRFKQKLAHAERLADRFDGLVDQIRTLDVSLTEHSERLDQVVNRKNVWLSKLKNDSTKIVELKQRLARLGSKLEVAKQRQSVAAFWVEGFGPRGLKHMVVMSMVDELNKYSSSNMNFLTYGSTDVRIEYKRPTKAGKTQDKIVILVGDDSDGWLPYELCSDGEQTRAAIAIEAALGRLVRNQNALSMFDEAFKGLDQLGLQRALELLQKEGKASKVICVDHDSSVSSFTDHTITVVRQNGVTRRAA